MHLSTLPIIKYNYETLCALATGLGIVAKQFVNTANDEFACLCARLGYHVHRLYIHGTTYAAPLPCSEQYCSHCW